MSLSDWNSFLRFADSLNRDQNILNYMTYTADTHRVYKLPPTPYILLF